MRFHLNTNNSFGNPERQDRSCGFSLVELLAVIAIIAVLAGLGITAFNQMGGSSGVGGTVDVMSEMVSHARLEAISLGEGALIAIDVDPSSDSKADPNDQTRWRRAAVFRYVAADPTAKPAIPTSGWVLVGKAVLFPQGSYFYAPSSRMDETDTAPTQLDFKSSTVQDGTSGTKCQVVKFNGLGFVKEPNARLVFTRGVLVNGAFANPEADLKAARRGFVLRKTGRPAFFETTQQIDNLSS